MSGLLDTNILVAAVTADTNRSEQAVKVLNELDDGFTSILNVMELRSVLSKKKGFDRERITAIEGRISNALTVVFPDASDVVRANSRQSDDYLYPMDALILATAESVEQPLVMFDTELLEHGAVEPASVL